jgi:CheY-like chemotaxis protein
MLRILLVEDSRDDADLVRFALEDAGLAFELHRVCDEAGLRAAVADCAPDAAVSDLNLPGYSGVLALQLLHALCPGIPLVLMTGADPELLAPLPDLPAVVLDKAELDRLPALLGAAARG